MSWSDVGDWIKNNAGSGAALVGSLLTGNIPGAVAAGVSMVSSATGSNDPEKALQALQADPATLVKLKELTVQNDENIRQHIEAMTKLQLEDEQAEHSTTQKTIQSGDNSEDTLVRRTRPLMAWASLLCALLIVVFKPDVTNHIDTSVLGLLLSPAWAYMGLRQIGKGVSAVSAAAAVVKSQK